MKNFVLDINVNLKTKIIENNFLSFQDAREFVAKLGIKKLIEWHEYSKLKRPKNIPSNPQKVYKKEWSGFPNFLGYEFDRANLCAKTFKKYSVNESFFDVPSADMFYILGFWYADGCIVDNKFILTQHTDRKYLLENISKKMNSTHPIQEIKNRCDLIINSNRIIKSIINHGGVRAKSKKMLFPQVPKEFLPHFIRGHFDGDGSIGFYNERLLLTITSGSNEFLKSLKVYLGESMALGGSLVSSSYITSQGDSKVYRLVYSHNDAIAICNYMYGFNCQDALFLKDKYLIFSDNKSKSIVNRRNAFLGYDDAKKITKELNCSGKREYFKMRKENKLQSLPSRPDIYYKNNGWRGWVEWVGGSENE